jgi:hypothetical protein
VQRRPEDTDELGGADILDEKASALVAAEVRVELARMCDRRDRVPPLN